MMDNQIKQFIWDHPEYINSIRLSPTELLIYRFLRDRGRILECREIAEDLNFGLTQVNAALNALYKKGYVAKIKDHPWGKTVTWAAAKHAEILGIKIYPNQVEVYGYCKKLRKDITANKIAEELDLSPELAEEILDSLYRSRFLNKWVSEKVYYL